MGIIDRYLLRQFLQAFLICLLSLTGLYIVIDAFTNLEEFLRCTEHGASLLPLMGKHYAYQSIVFFDRTSSLLVMIAAMFTVAWIRRHNELTALMSAGISRVRVVAPVIVAAIAITLLAAANRELVIPHFREELTRKSTDLLGDVPQEVQPTYDNETGIRLHGNNAFRNEKRIAKPNFILPPALDHYGKHLAAENARYLPAEGGRPSGYLLDGVTRPKDLDQHPSLSLDDRPVLITPAGAPEWLEPGQCFVASNVTFDQLSGGQQLKQFSSTAQLIEGLRNPSLGFGADVRVAIHSRMVQPVLDVTLLFLGLPLVLRQRDRNVFVAIGLCAVLVSGFLGVVMAFQHLGRIYLIDAALAAWLPLMIFVPVAVGMADSMRR